MPTNFATIAFTPTVKRMQTEQGSRAMYQRLDMMDDDVCFGPAERAFIADRDSFYQASVSETGWPYVQFKGGPKGFLKVLDDHTLGYADFRGNLQYISLGNLAGNQKLALILMDYPNQRRLKIWAEARIVDLADDPVLSARLALPDYRARVERGIILDVAAFDWNCPQHITPRYSINDLAELTPSAL